MKKHKKNDLSPAKSLGQIYDMNDINLCLDDSTILDKVQSELSKKFAPKKNQSFKLSVCYDVLSKTDIVPKSRAHRVSDCGSFLVFHCSLENNRLAAANFCKDRLCPMCNWRRSLKIFSQVSAVMNELEKQGYCFAFLTLTVKNCDTEHLAESVQALLDGFRFMYNKHKVFKSLVLGSFRSLEITKNKKTNMYHPHLHVVLCLPFDYFINGYLTQAEWTEMWKKSCKLEYQPIVHIEKIKPGTNGMSSAVAEASKYAVKDSDYLNGTLAENVADVSALISAISNKKLCSFTGIFAKIRRDLQLDDVENGNLVNTEIDEIRPELNYLIVRCHWNCGYYEIKEIKKNENKE